MSALRIIVLGYIVRGPLAGHAWHHLQYVRGLQLLGHEVYFFEDSDDFESCYDPTTHEMSAEPRYGLRFANMVFTRAGLRDHWAYYDAHTATWHGPAGAKAVDLCRSADVCLNVSGVNPLREWLMKIPRRVFVDTDPAFTQLRHLRDSRAMEAALRHNTFMTFGENFGRPDCTIPDDGLPWQPTRQPIVLDAWPVRPGPPDGSFSTMMQWQSYPDVTFDGQTYGTKSMSFPAYFDLPAKVDARLEVAVGGALAPRERLHDAGWIVRDPLRPSRDPWVYQKFIRESKAEFSVAKHGYVMTASGWFSDRSAEYLASGRPVVVQQTGFSQWLEVHRGVVAFGSPAEAVEAIEKVNRDYEAHCRAARVVAEAYFDARLVLTSLLQRASRAVHAA